LLADPRAWDTIPGVKKRLKRVLITAGVLLLAGFAGLNVLAYLQVRSMTHFTAGGVRTEKPEELGLGRKIKVLFTGVTLPRPTARKTPDQFGLPAPEVWRIPFGESERGLGAWYFPAAATNAALVILHHGYAAEMASLLPEAQVFRELGCAVLLVDFQGSGTSEGSATTIGYTEAEDVAAAFRYARTRLPGRTCVLFGSSMGAAAILRSIADLGVEPDGIILVAVFDSLLNTVRNRFAVMGVPSFPSAQLIVFWGGRQWGFNGFAHNPVDYARRVRCPALVMHGTDDPRARLADGRRVFDALPGRKRFIEFANAGHESYIKTSREEWTKAVAAFLAEARAPDPAP
jgi:hypothetical protein